MRISLKWKFSAFIAALLLFVVIMMSFAVLKGISQYQREQTESAMAKQSEAASARIQQEYVTGARLDAVTFMKLQGRKLAVELGASSGGNRVLLYDGAGETVGDSLPMADAPDVGEALAYAIQNKIAYIVKGDIIDYLAPIAGPEGQLGVFHLQASLAAQHVFYRNVQRMFIAAGVGVLAVSLLFGFVYMNRQAKDIRRLNEAAERIRNGFYDRTPKLARRDELGDLSDGIAAMSEAIQTNIRSQKQFFNNISHELKTPLTSIRAYADLLDMYKDDPELLEEAREAIAQESGRLFELVENALRLSSLERYEFEQRPEKVELKELLEELCMRLKGKADRYGIAINKHLHSAEVWADKESLTHIFMNVLDNAIKYNVQGGSVTLTLKAGDSGLAETEVRDTGIGIPEELRARIFEPFYTANRDRARQSGGSGLGLALVKQLTEKQNGHIQVDSAEGKGTRFVIAFELYDRRKHLQV